MSSDTRKPSEMRIRRIDRVCISELIEIGDLTGLSPWTAQNYLDEMENPNACILRGVGDEPGTVAFIVGRIVNVGVDPAGPDAEIYNIAVIPGHQGNGLGQQMLDAFLNECRERRVAKVWLEVRESNHRAIRFYLKNKFRSVQSRKNFYNDPVENAVLMCLELRELS